MTDVVFVVVLIAFFAAFAGFVRLCERVIGPDPEGVELATGPDPTVDEVEDQPEVAA
jgi:hypothetical protein